MKVSITQIMICYLYEKILMAINNIIKYLINKINNGVIGNISILKCAGKEKVSSLGRLLKLSVSNKVL